MSRRGAASSYTEPDELEPLLVRHDEPLELRKARKTAVQLLNAVDSIRAQTRNAEISLGLRPFRRRGQFA